MIKRGHKPIVDALAKMSEGFNWVRNLPAILLADRSTIWTSTRLTPYYLKQLHSRHTTDYLQFQHLFQLLCTRIGDAPTAPPPPYDRLSSISAPIPPPSYIDRWCSSGSTSAMRLIVFNSSAYSTFSIKWLVNLHYFYLRHATEIIGDAPADPPPPCDRLSSILANIPPLLYKDRWSSSSSTP